MLHFGGYTLATSAGGNPGYFGELDSSNAAILAGPGDQIYGGVDNGTPPQYVAFAQQIGSSETSSDLPEGAMLVGSIVVGASGSSDDNSNPTNDGYLQIYQQLFDNVQMRQPQRRQWQGQYSSTAIYYPGEIVTESGSEYINATEYAMVGYDPATNASSAPLTDGVEYDTLKNFWMPLGGGGGGGISMATVTAVADNYVLATIGSTANVKVAMPPLLQRLAYDNKSVSMPDGTHNYAWQSNGVRSDKTSIVNALSVIYPPYIAPGSGNAWSNIVVCQPAGGTGVSVANNAVTYQDITPGRIWKVQASYCNNGNASYVLVDGSASNVVISGDS